MSETGMSSYSAATSADVILTDSQGRFTPGISVFFPAYNDAPSLPMLLERTFEMLRRVASDYEVIVINDGSSDATAAVLERLLEQYAPQLQIVTHDRNRGYGAALRSGFTAATKEFIFYTDGDGQYDPLELESLLRQVRPDTGLVNGYKIERSDPWHRVAIGWVYNRFARWLFRIQIRDIDCDFRLIRREALDLAALRSTGGAICVELVRSLELNSNAVAEVPVHHYERQHGRSQFFRVRSLLTTLLEMFAVFLRLVAMPTLRGTGQPETSTPFRLTRSQAALTILSIILLSLLAYARALGLPFIADDYIQIQLGRQYGPIDKWAALSHDALYRCRATSIVLTYWLEHAVGLVPVYYNFASLVLHIVNALLVFALGLWRPVGWRMSALAACFFAFSQRHNEAVIWFAAVPELLVFFFVLAGFLFWVQWINLRAPLFYASALACFILGLLSKESAVVLVPLCAVAVLFHTGRPIRRLWGLIPFTILAFGYFWVDYAARATHLHFNDGTFSLNAPFLMTMVRSIWGLLWVWGFVFLPVALFSRPAREERNFLVFSGAWMVITLLPYSFLTYMPRVPSRHTYMASMGLSLIVAAGLLAFRQYATKWHKVWMVPSVILVIILHQCGYLWTVKHRQYLQRAQPTEELLRVAKKRRTEIHAKCFPYSQYVAEAALDLTLGASDRPKFLTGTEFAQKPDAIDFCNESAYGSRQ